ncbi:non-hydrolyzing UDP-N-acetylglucosamine 2-epimerase [Paraburkholderia sp. 35.1]|uniref:non-hydrolyzing UDP-N-acetylglucosamine 2-epimerase n=1 Tax=Paraburkholderia sp. 35.1 TaxID=2991058 RepID=UPI003D25BD99
MKVMVVMGTRPEVIKLAPLVRALRSEFDTIVCASGQHRDMAAQALEFFGIEPDITLETMHPGQSLNALASRLIAALDRALDETRPDWVIVQGDTTTAFCAGFAAFQRGIRVGHVEAGLRTGDLASPFPEEANRSLLGRIATLHFAPTSRARDSLLSEGVAPEKIVVTGNTVVDAIGEVRASWSVTPPASPLPAWHGAQQHVLVTCHRRENFGDVLQDICRVLRDLCQRYSDYRWVFPVHLNPAVRGPVHRELDGIPNLALIEPVDYPTSLHLISGSAVVVSDSGGIQEEAPTFGVPVVVMRNHTERREGVDAGFATLAGQSAASIESAVIGWLDDPARRAALRDRANPYGDGLASRRIVDSLRGRPVEVFVG